jgi:hypothetical protein
MKHVRRILKWSAAALFVAFLAIQLVPVDRTNPPVETEVAASVEVRSILRRACYDCHSHETVWPWYSRIAPVSWLVARDVHEGRRHVNFSTWNRLSEREQREAREESWEEVEAGRMPLWIYRPLHPSARLSEADRSALRAWAGVENADGRGRGRGEGRESEREGDDD